VNFFANRGVFCDSNSGYAKRFAGGRKSKFGVKRKSDRTVSENGNGHHALVPTKDLPVSKQISNEQLIAEEKSLIEKETEVEKIISVFAAICGFFRCRKSSGCSRFIFISTSTIAPRAAR
jgi:hypothetical protein